MPKKHRKNTHTPLKALALSVASVARTMEEARELLLGLIGSNEAGSMGEMSQCLRRAKKGLEKALQTAKKHPEAWRTAQMDPRQQLMLENVLGEKRLRGAAPLKKANKSRPKRPQADKKCLKQTDRDTLDRYSAQYEPETQEQPERCSCTFNRTYPTVLEHIDPGCQLHANQGYSIQLCSGDYYEREKELYGAGAAIWLKRRAPLSYAFVRRSEASIFPTCDQAEEFLNGMVEYARCKIVPAFNGCYGDGGSHCGDPGCQACHEAYPVKTDVIKLNPKEQFRLHMLACETCRTNFPKLCQKGMTIGLEVSKTTPNWDYFALCQSKAELERQQRPDWEHFGAEWEAAKKRRKRGPARHEQEEDEE